ncbi:xanthine dehydrogenase family protein molybdopterin-binding subunit [Pseudoduganella umbonata]|uniref:Isoquinoline 1-oxidoreductase beta subunit n=1 Tax=Pseudoduganella umbonata TaxID=864828 RepID=A0A4P8HLE1_9BURK|nr:molybdopterin cofactor-binding domain-containing protein [Pseudoduganella umbonata]MBB3221294.1 isoquinoline 1-oxidoreductase beta subunit [Pseudoduganella umbonata]QCP10467.1 xanthine dehydrogenase family protein molybdopterin-binding subunit [Pseudoduganella umbonata]
MAPPNSSRRLFLKAGAAATGGLLLQVAIPGALARALPAGTAFSPNAFIRIGADGKVMLTMPYVEMGQGTYTSIPMLIAEELEIDLAQIVLEHAPADAAKYANPALGGQMTGGSTTMRAAWMPMRQAGAAARILLVRAAANQWRVDPASCSAERGAVIHAASGRRLRYGQLAEAAGRLPAPAGKDIVLKEPGRFRLIGTAAKRLDTAAKLDGSARYGIDVVVPGMKVAALAISPVAGGRVASLDQAAALKIRGVRQVVRLDDCAAVVADNMGAANKGIAALALQWEDGPSAALTTAAIVADMAQASQGAGAQVRSENDPEGALRGAARVLEAIYELPFLAHAPMEPVNCTVHVRADGCDVWTGTQIMGAAHAVAAHAAGLPLERVTVHNFLLGGAFGRRLEVDMIERAVRIGKEVPHPVKVIWSREQDIQHDMFRPYFYDRLRAGLDAAGKPLAWTHHITGSSVLGRFMPAAFNNGFDSETVDGADAPPYAFPAIGVSYVRHEPQGVATAFWRGVGPAHNVFVVESFIDELADAAGTDPLRYRLDLLGHNPRARKVLELAAEKAGWEGPSAGKAGRGLAVQFAFGTYMAMVADVVAGPEGELRVVRVVCALDCGVVINPDTVRAQVESAVVFGVSAALYGDVTIKDGRVEQSNFHDYRVLRMHEAPVVETHIVPSGETPGGMGEPGTACVMPAVANAVHALAGKRIRKMPIGATLPART